MEALVKDNLEEGISKERILQKLQQYFALTMEQAEEYYESTTSR